MPDIYAAGLIKELWMSTAAGYSYRSIVGYEARHTMSTVDRPRRSLDTLPTSVLSGGTVSGSDGIDRE